jgi:hypothetical protein
MQASFEFGGSNDEGIKVLTTARAAIVTEISDASYSHQML